MDPEYRPDDRANPTRREFLVSGGVATAAAAAVAQEFGAYVAPPTYVARVRRGFDLLDLELAFVNFRERDGVLVPYPGRRALVVVHFPPQNLAEAIFDETHNVRGFEVDPLDPSVRVGPPPGAPIPNANSPAPPVRSYLSGPSRLVFEAPADARLPLRVGPPAPVPAVPPGACRVVPPPGVVDAWFNHLARWPLRVPREAGQPTFTPRPPAADETCLELPYRLFITPRSDRTRWLTTSDRMPFDRPVAGTTEVWNAALVSRDRVDPAKPAEDLAALDPELAPLTDITLRATAVYSPDFAPAQAPGIGTFFPGNQPLSLNALTRHLLVDQMRRGNGWIDVDHLVLTALGSDAFLAYFNQQSFDTIIADQVAQFRANPGVVPGTAPEAPPGTLMVWKHRMVVGRDVYVIEAFFGALFPMVHPAVYVEVTRRKFASRRRPPGGAGVGPPGAYLLKRRYIVVRRPDRTFTTADSAHGRAMFAKSVVLGVSQTPDLEAPDTFPIEADLDKPGYPKVDPNNRPLVFVPRPINGPRDGKPFRWPLTLTDGAGRQAHLTDACLLFASNVILGHQAWQALRDTFTDWAVPGQSIALAPETVHVGRPPAPDRPPHALTAPEHEGVSRLGDAIRTWQAAAAGVLPTPDLVRRLRAWTTLEAVQRVLRPAWVETAAKTFDEFAREELIRADVFATRLEAEFGQIVTRHRDKFRGDVGAVVDQITRVRGELDAAVGRLRPPSLDALAAELARVGGLPTGAQAALREFHTFLSGAERVSAALETHAIRFGSRLVDQLYAAPNGAPLVLKTLADKIQAGDAPGAAIEEARQALGKVLDRAEYERLRKAMDAELGAIAQAGGDEVRRLAVQYVRQFEAAQKDAVAVGSALFHPVVEQVRGIIPSMKAIVPNYPVETIALTTDYLARGIRDVEHGIFAQIERGEKELADAKKLLSDKVDAIKNGLATPRAMIQGLSTRLGAVAADGVQQLKDMALKKIGDGFEGFNLENAIPDAKLFGAIGLRELIGTLGAGRLPSINLVKTPEVLRHVWKWTIPIAPPGGKKTFLGVLTYQNDLPPVCLHIEIETTAKLPKPEEALAGKRPEGRVRLDAYVGHWDDRADRPAPPAAGESSLTLDLLQLIAIRVRQVRLEAEYALGDAQTPRIKPEIVKVDFLGPLKFVKELQEKLGNFGGGFKAELTPTHLALSYGFLIPPVSFGVFSLRNIQLGAGLTLPFGDDPLGFRFNLSSFAVPFELTVMAFGGRGFLGVAIDTRGGRLLEGALEFGGSLAFDVGVASGGLYVMGGAYFRITQSQTTLSAYIRAGGTLDVLGLIHASVEFMLAMSYRKSDGGSELYGTATVTVSIELFMFSIDVNITMEKRLAGSRDEGGGQALTLPGGPFAVLAAAPGEPARAAPPRLAYFARHDPDVGGRFPWDPRRPHESACRWVDEYWSQFDLSRG